MIQYFLRIGGKFMFVSKNGETIQNYVDLYKQGDKSYRDKIIVFYKERLESVISEYYNLGVDKDDLVSSFYEGLLLAIDKLSDLKVPNVSRYFYYNIRTSIESNILAYYGIYLIDSSYKINSNIINVLKARRDLKKILKRVPSSIEISEYTGINLDKVSKILNFLFKSDVQVDNEINLELENYYYDTQLVSRTKDIIDKFLNEEEKKVFYLLFEKDLTLIEIGRVLNVSKQRVFQIKEKIEEKIRVVSNCLIENDYQALNVYELKQKKLYEVIGMAVSGDTMAYSYIVNYIQEYFVKFYGDFVSLNEIKGIVNNVVKNYIKREKNHKDFIDNVKQTVRFIIENLILDYYGVGLKKTKHMKNSMRLMTFNVLKVESEFKVKYGYKPSSRELSEYMNEDENLIQNVRKLIVR